MAINEIYGIYDDASECFVQFTPCLNEKCARLQLTQLFKYKKLSIPLLYDYPNLYSVYKLGTFDDNTGIFTNDEHHSLVFNFGSIDNGVEDEK